MSEPDVTTTKADEDVLYPLWEHDDEQGKWLTLEYKGMSCVGHAFPDPSHSDEMQFLVALGSLCHDVHWQLAARRNRRTEEAGDADAENQG